MKKEELHIKLLALQKKLIEKEEKHYLTYCKEEHLTCFISNLHSYYSDANFLNTLTLPYFEEEIQSDRKAAYEQFLFLFEINEVDELIQRFQHTDITDFLLVIGQRLTSATDNTINALPPLNGDVFKASFEQYNIHVTKAVRAFEKHSERTTNNFWGRVEGNPKQKEEKVKELIQYLLHHKTWWNVFYHFKHELIYEVRIASGHGARWKKSNLEFIGFVEPFLNSENEK
ncbi:hypothetical protein [uncultured Tenacibaculum sp.]|uniref:hypothetical protein n=1 Tax=uncultured Tenacibaculum sp. TaxID=174713 RepID=UPI00262D01FC|nr:hypothetical protein [uncultured Tenacibaculum sp.]